MSRVVIHPACAALPALPTKAFDDLCASIKAIGLQQPILTDADGLVLDGKNRLWACEKVGVAPRFQKVTIAGDPVRWVFELNRHRLRKNGQLALAGARLANAEHGSNQYQRKVDAANEASSIDTIKEIAKSIGISKAAIDRAKFILAPKRAVDELIEYLERGEITLGCAEWAAKASHEEQTLACAVDVKAVRLLAASMRQCALASENRASELSAPFNGLLFARMAIADLEQIRLDDSERAEAFAAIRRWLDENA